MPATSLSSWTKEAESIETAKNLLYFRQLVGLKFDKKRLASLEGKTKAHYTRYLRSHGREDGASRGLFLLSVGTVGMAATYRQLLELYKARATKVVSRDFKFGGVPVNWGSWRQFAASTDDSAARKEIFDDFVRKSSVLAPLVQRRFEAYRALLSELGTDPLSVYLEHEGLSYERLTSMVENLGGLARAPFRESLRGYSSEIVGRPAEYYDDYYFFRNRVFRRYSERLPTKARPIPKIVKTLKQLGLDASRIAVDDADRKGKSASAFCSAIKVPTDVRISYRKANPLEDFSSVFHEFGHAIHFSSIDPRASFSDRYAVANGVAEIFSIFFEGLMHEKPFLTSELGLPEEVADDVLRRYRFNCLFFATFYAANSTLKLRYWHDGLAFDALDELYSDLTERFLGVRYPGAYWKLHHVMPDYILYSPSYLVAAVRALELRNALAARFGATYWRERGSGKALLELMRPGQSLDLSFSKLDEAAYVKSLSTDAA
ncbi:MAG: M3 family metallopeptidase [Thaumarchaeota archaeon]|nr:M3 family metallopeptidase [Nitrososphaerota archaeon]